MDLLARPPSDAPVLPPEAAQALSRHLWVLGLPLGFGCGAVGWGLSQHGPAVVLALIGFASMLLFVSRQMRDHYPHHRLGSCNAVTLGRAAVVCALIAPLMAPGLVRQGQIAGWVLPVLAIAALALDGVDGWLARRSGLASGFGARFDMEVDAALAAVLCLLALVLEKAGVWLLALGFLRYAWVMAGALWPWLQKPLPDRFSRKLVCVIQLSALIALLLPVVQPPVSQGVAALALFPLLWSFARDALWCARQPG